MHLTFFFLTRCVYVGTVEGMNTYCRSCQGAANLFILFPSGLFFFNV